MVVFFCFAAFVFLAYRFGPLRRKWLNVVGALIGLGVILAFLPRQPQEPKTPEPAAWYDRQVELDPSGKFAWTGKVLPQTQPPDPPKPESSAMMEAREATYIETSKDAIRARFKDPDSAEFRNVVMARFRGTPVVCGEVNSKNAFGGFAGYQHFIAGGNVLTFLEEEMDRREFAKSWNAICLQR